MKRFFLILFLLTPIFIQIALTQELSLEIKIRIADEYWKSHRLGEAIQQYKLIIDEEFIPDEYKSLVYLRLAEAQFQAKLPEECRITLS